MSPELFAGIQEVPERMFEMGRDKDGFEKAVWERCAHNAARVLMQHYGCPCLEGASLQMFKTRVKFRADDKERIFFPMSFRTDYSMWRWHQMFGVHIIVVPYEYMHSYCARRKLDVGEVVRNLRKHFTQIEDDWLYEPPK